MIPHLETILSKGAELMSFPKVSVRLFHTQLSSSQKSEHAKGLQKFMKKKICNIGENAWNLIF